MIKNVCWRGDKALLYSQSKGNPFKMDIVKLKFKHKFVKMFQIMST